MTRAHADPRLPAVVRLEDGRLFEGNLPASRHRRMQIGMLHEHTSGLVELAAGFRAEGQLVIGTRDKPDYFLPGGAAEAENWLDALLELAADEHDRRRRELFVAVCERNAPKGHKLHVPRSSWLWVDVDDPGRLPALFAFFGEATPALPYGRQPHLVVESAGVTQQTDRAVIAAAANGPPASALAQIAGDGPFGGVHAYWRLIEPLEAVTVATSDDASFTNPLAHKPSDSDILTYADPRTGEVFEGELEIVEQIEQMNLRLIHAIGHRYDADGHQIATVADPSCRERGRVMRLAGSRHGESGRYARIVFADFNRPAYRLEDLVGDLADPRDRPAVHHHVNGGPSFDDDDPYKQESLISLYQRMTGNDGPNRNGRVRCPNRYHEDEHPSCRINHRVFICDVCGAGGAEYQLVSAYIGGPTKGLRGEDFKAAKAELIKIVGERPQRRVGAAQQRALAHT